MRGLNGGEPGHRTPYTRARLRTSTKTLQEARYRQGIYDFDAFEQTLRDAFPKTGLSHIFWKAVTPAPGY